MTLTTVQTSGQIRSGKMKQNNTIICKNIAAINSPAAVHSPAAEVCQRIVTITPSPLILPHKLQKLIFCKKSTIFINVWTGTWLVTFHLRSEGNYLGLIKSAAGRPHRKALVVRRWVF